MNYHDISLIDLVYYYIEKNYDNIPSKKIYDNIYNGIKKLLKAGFTSEIIINEINKSNKKININKKLGVYEKNLLDPDIFYYHNNLRLAPECEYYIDNNGELKEKNIVYYLEMKASYTMKDLIDYLINGLGIKYDLNKKRYLNALLSILKEYTLDEVLYMIDAYSNKRVIDDLPPTDNPFKIKETIIKEIAFLNLENKKTLSIEGGTNKIVIRKRKLLFRNRNKTGESI